MLQLLLFCGLLAALTKPAGLYLVRVLEPDGRTWLDRPLGPIERLIYRVLRTGPAQEQDWKRYTRSLLVFSLIGLLFTYAVLRLQHLLPLNPQNLGPVRSDLAFNTAASFATNTNWQNYAGETTLSYFSQMVGLVFQNFVSAAAGIAVAAALVRGLARRSSKTVGNFWVDLVRINLYLLVPLSMVFSIFLTSQGIVQNFHPYVNATTVDGATAQLIAQGPAASQAAIKMLGTNGGGFFNANAAHPYENPTPLSNLFQMLAILLIPSGLTYYLGRKVKNPKHGRAVWIAMAILFLGGALVCWRAESVGNPRLRAEGVSLGAGNTEGKEVRFGPPDSALFATVTTAASCGAVNSLHDSFTPLGGLVPLFNIQLGEVVFGGVGAGLYGMLVFVVLAVFLTGLMVGRTPEYLGKRIEAYDVKVSVLAVLVAVFAILGFSAWASIAPWGLAARGNSGPHGPSEILYAFSSAA
ncbi:MAG TPA: potassium-transporting ATPase subunit KdpA, partial [Acidobacteriota bacterium]|nr:potassium-transporting ATPase subunit KdpA [Acidobacteriota bacterium]